MKQILLILFVIVLSGGCNNYKRKEVHRQDVSAQIRMKKEKFDFSFTPQVKHAKGFSIEVKNGFKEITVYNPWKKDIVLKKYILISQECEVPDDIPENVFYVKTPVKSVALFSNSHIGSFAELGLLDKIVGLTRANRIYNNNLQSRFNKGSLPNLGGAHNTNLDIEKIVELAPELIILSALNEVKAGETHLNKIGFNMAYALNWMESTPLGRAEWIKFIAAFFNKDLEANNFFENVESRYVKLQKMAGKLEKKSSVVMGWSYSGVWYVPGGRNYMVNYLRDAGANYFLLADTTRGSIPMSVESVMDHCSEADIWLSPGQSKSLKEIENADHIYTQFKAYRNGDVYNIYKLLSLSGGSDWWETAPIRPDLVLKDLIKVFHPEILPQDTTYFISKLQ
ncbi:hypothetical protein BZG02_14390 [Labilibaculum filiforme]|uniref:Fe/B12 periplasmic-binding domain-containing protein n=1 Tax=Labilibaculum filiforme TaxID=1940526 RepID=A0A2N3HUT0_9BACT|nr:ABC transporter substrate-binding protein [Labilibaculum filiforme]PKQ61812.1 hypothetical protein BZG02_14390 [Labilibaculum filiforme]